jgi:hypothetical protein
MIQDVVINIKSILSFSLDEINLSLSLFRSRIRFHKQGLDPALSDPDKIAVQGTDSSYSSNKNSQMP